MALTDRLICPLSILGNVLIDYVLRTLLISQRLVLFMLRYELCLKLHYGIFNACSGQILDFSLRNGWCSIIKSPIVRCVSTSSRILQVVRHWVVSLASCWLSMVAKSALTYLALSFSLRVSRYKACLGWPIDLSLCHSCVRRGLRWAVVN